MSRIETDPHSPQIETFLRELDEATANALTYAEEKALSEELDEVLGFRISDTEGSVRDEMRANLQEEPAQLWAHLSPQVFQTPYPEIARMLLDADPEARFRSWVDLGAAYGRLGILLFALRANASFIGIEIAAALVDEARRVYRLLGIDPSAMRSGDCATEPLPEADAYLIYDFGKYDAIESALQALQVIARKRRITVVGRGRAIRDTIERRHPWLQVHAPLHRDHYSVYRS